MDPFSKWVETQAVPLLHSWRAAKFLYNDLVACWGKPYYIRTDNGTKFADSFALFCKGLVIIHYHITIGNSKANGQVEWIIRTLKDYIQCCLTKELATFWMNHLALALLLLYIIVSRIMGIVLFLLDMGRQLLLLSMGIPGLPSPPNQPTPDEEEAYLAKVSHIIKWL